MRLLRVLPASLPAYATLVPWACAVAQPSHANAVIVVISAAPGHALKSPAMMCCCEKLDAQAFISFIWVMRRVAESASRCVEKTFTGVPFTMICARATERE